MDPQTDVPSSRKLPSFAKVLGIVLLLCASAVGAAVWFGTDRVEGDSQVRKQERIATSFKAVELSLDAEVEVRIGDADSVTIEADSNILPLVATRVVNGTLQIQPARRNLSLKPTSMKIVVTARQVDRLAIEGAGDIKLTTALKTAKLKLEIAGSGEITIANVQADGLSASIAGSGDIRLAGAVRELSIEIAGAGDVEAPQLRAENVTVGIAGAGSATVWSVTHLDASIAGAGEVKYWGDPKLKTSVAGVGDFKRLGAAPR